MPASAVELEAVSKRYGTVEAVRMVDLAVEAGEVFGFVGSNGAGKTTTMRIILGVLTADSGEVRWKGSPLRWETRRRTGYMPEERGLYPKMRVHEQLVYLGRLHGLDSAAAIKEASHWLERLGLEERGRDEVQKLSQGNQQRVQLAASLIFRPVLLVLDEPFSGLDPVAVDLMSEVLLEQARAGVPVLFSSHQLDLVERLCDRVAIIEKGRIVESGRVADLRAAGPRRIWIDAPGAPEGWAHSLPGAQLVKREGSRLLLRLDPDADDQSILVAALRTGPVHEFRHDLPSLSELFREAVAGREVS